VKFVSDDNDDVIITDEVYVQRYDNMMGSTSNSGTWKWNNSNTIIRSIFGLVDIGRTVCSNPDVYFSSCINKVQNGFSCKDNEFTNRILIFNGDKLINMIVEDYSLLNFYSVMYECLSLNLYEVKIMLF